jgi:uncharacterized membrane protein
MATLNADWQEARDISLQLRTSASAVMRRRRGVVGLSLLAASAMGVIGLYQTGLIRHIPEPGLPPLDADEVDASPEAYRKLSTPDALLGLGSYAATAALAAMGGENRAERRPWIPLALAGKVGFDLVQASLLTRDQWVRHGSFCSWCLMATAATVAAVPLALPEAVKALRGLRLRPLRSISTRPR